MSEAEVESQGASICVTLKAGTEYDAPWITIRGNSAAEVESLLSSVNPVVAGASTLMGKATVAAAQFKFAWNGGAPKGAQISAAAVAAAFPAAPKAVDPLPVAEQLVAEKLGGTPIVVDDGYEPTGFGDPEAETPPASPAPSWGAVAPANSAPSWGKSAAAPAQSFSAPDGSPPAMPVGSIPEELQGAPAGAFGDPATCKHGVMSVIKRLAKSGKNEGKPYWAWDCPADYRGGDKCSMVFINK